MDPRNTVAMAVTITDKYYGIIYVRSINTVNSNFITSDFKEDDREYLSNNIIASDCRNKRNILDLRLEHVSVCCTHYIVAVILEGFF